MTRRGRRLVDAAIALLDVVYSTFVDPSDGAVATINELEAAIEDVEENEARRLAIDLKSGIDVVISGETAADQAAQLRRLADVLDGPDQAAQLRRLDVDGTPYYR
jgi:hypothetical protein